MAILFDAIAATLALDLNWWLWIIMNNLFWVFGFMVAAYCLYGSKKIFPGFIVITFITWVGTEFVAHSGWVMFGAIFLALHYITRLAVAGVSESIPGLQKNLPFILALQFLVILIIYNIFMR